MAKARMVKVDVRLPEPVREALRLLDRSGGTPVVVGGAVRDLLLGKEPKDYDIATSLTPDTVLDIFEKAGWTVYPKGVKYGVVGVIHPRTGMEIEVATFRSELYDYKSRKPHVTFTTSLLEDLARRDFTINAMALRPGGEIVDPYGGLKDLRAGVVRFVGSPEERIMEDPLRMLRALRFAAKYGFRIEPSTLQAIRGFAGEIRRVSRERIGDEIEKMLAKGRPWLVPALLYASRLHLHVLPQLEEMVKVRHDRRGHHYGETVLKHTMDVLRRLHSVAPPASTHGGRIVRLAALLHDIAKPWTVERRGDKTTFYGHDVLGSEMARKILHRLWRRPSRVTVDVARLVRSHHWPYQASAAYTTPRRLAARAAIKHGELAPLILLHAYADSGDTLYLDAYRAAKEILSMPKPLLSGRDIIELYGVEPGPAVGELKKKLYELQLLNNISDREELIQAACRELGLCPGRALNAAT